MRILLAVLCFTSTLGLATRRIHEAPAGAPATGQMAPCGEPGEPLHVAGTVVDGNGKPIPGASLYVYQTDHEGYYGVKPASDSRNPRLKLFLRSGANGGWSFDTVKPGSYPDTRNPAHIHFEVSAPGRASRIFEIVFEGDPFITERMRSRSVIFGEANRIRSRRGTHYPALAAAHQQEVTLSCQS